jgi:hypothetical protein
MNAHETTTSLNVAFKSYLLVCIQHIHCGAEKNNSAVVLQAVFYKLSGIRSRIYKEIVFPSQFLNGRHTRRNRLVIIAFGFCKHQYPSCWSIGSGLGLQTFSREENAYGTGKGCNREQ